MLGGEFLATGGTILVDVGNPVQRGADFAVEFPVANGLARFHRGEFQAASFNWMRGDKAYSVSRDGWIRRSWGWMASAGASNCWGTM